MTLVMVVVMLGLVVLVPQITILIELLGCTVLPLGNQVFPLLFELKLQRGRLTCNSLVDVGCDWVCFGLFSLQLFLRASESMILKSHSLTHYKSTKLLKLNLPSI